MATPSSTLGKGRIRRRFLPPHPSRVGRFLLSLTLFCDSFVVWLGPALFSLSRRAMLVVLFSELWVVRVRRRRLSVHAAHRSSGNESTSRSPLE